MREFGGNDYTAAQIESGLRYIVSVDPNLIADRTYFVAEIDGALVGCGGWTHRAPGFRTSANGAVAPADDTAALMRAIFVDPDGARRIMAFLEACAREAGNRQAALVAPPLPTRKPVNDLSSTICSRSIRFGPA